MNIKDGDAVHQSIAAAGISARKERKSKKGQGRSKERSGHASEGLASDSLTREAKRLLGLLEQPETWAFLDMTDSSSVLIHRRRSGISVGAGRFPRTVAEDLVRRDLACWQRTSSRTLLLLTKAGQAHLRRRAAPEQELAFLCQHRETAVAEVKTTAGPARVRVDAEESPLDWLRRRKDRNGEAMIDEASYQAGERLRTDIMLAGLLPGVTARWDGMPKSAGPSSPGEATERMVAARQRLRHAFDAIGGDFSDLLLDICGFIKGLEQIERERQWPARSAKIVVRLALARLAEHYGIETAARGPAASRGIRMWRAVVIEGGRI
ncbi:hypothetical protein GGR34_003114 [Microvirga flocculans]|uniref:DUF6456 domain-containing protein n=1 Tax=Microvirga flocculans TaxID=217168 RepID=A0A7W6IH75_9HYPH|nr:DUF6456 domain-containing protein [Microvirga flocculans]MBB4041437.1 hypothetical protein [Microvirga flocculans]